MENMHVKYIVSLVLAVTLFNIPVVAHACCKVGSSSNKPNGTYPCTNGNTTVVVNGKVTERYPNSSPSSGGTSGGGGSSTSCNSCSSCNACGKCNSGSSCSGGCSTPPNPPGYGNTCAASNVCGIPKTGSIGCQGECRIDANHPSGFGTSCSVPTPCGAVIGRINCSGQCSISRLNTCPGVIILGDDSDEELDASGNKVPKFGCSARKVKVRALPLLVRRGNVSAIQWIANEASSCTATGGGQTWTGLNGVKITNPIQETTKYTISCQPIAGCPNPYNTPFTANVDVTVVPDWQEI
jgi:hypothetical protein